MKKGKEFIPKWYQSPVAMKYVPFVLISYIALYMVGSKCVDIYGSLISKEIQNSSSKVEDMEASNVLAPACSVVSELKFDCHPDANATADSCRQRGCCWSPTNYKHSHKISTPFCYYSSGYSIYSFVKVSKSENGIDAQMVINRPSGFPKDVQRLGFQIRYETCSRLRIRIYDLNNVRWESPIPSQPSSTTGCLEETDFEVDVYKNLGQFVVRRKSTGIPIFDTVSAAPLIFSDQFLQISTFLPSPYIYGLGQHLDGLLLDVNWQQRVLWNSDHANSPNTNLYGSHPFYLAMEPSGHAHGVFLLNSNAMDVTLQPSPAATFHVTGGILDFFVFSGPTPDKVVSQYKEIVGNPFLPPYWSLGYHQCRYGYKTLDETRKVWHRTRKAKIPFDVQWNDIDYMERQNDFTFDPIKFAGLPQFVDELHKNEMHYVFIIDAAIGAGEKPGVYPPYDDGIKQGIFIKNSSGDPFVGKVWNKFTSVWPDFTMTAAMEYWTKWLQYLHQKVRYDGLWLDMNEPSNFWSGQEDGCPESSLDDPPYLPPVTGGRLCYRTLCMTARHVWGSHYNVHNLHGISEVAATYDSLKIIKDGLRPFIISRSTFPGSGTIGGHWTGDVHSDWFNLWKSVGDILTTSIIGIPMVGADICGFNGNTTVKLCNRWVQLGAFYPFSRNHNTLDGIEQDPVALGPLVTKSARNALQERYKLLPYFYTLFFKDHMDGVPVIKPLFFNNVRDKETYGIDRQFMWGDALMVVPVLEEDATSVTGYLPAGIWYDWYSGEALTNRSRIYFKFDAPIDKIPLVVKGGHIIPLQTPGITTVQSRKNPFGLLVALNQSGFASGDLILDDGETSGTLENKEFLTLTFVAATKKLLSHVKLYKWTPNTAQTLGWIDVIGVQKKVRSVKLNGKAIKFDYNSKSKILSIDNLKHNFIQNFTLEW